MRPWVGAVLLAILAACGQDDPARVPGAGGAGGSGGETTGTGGDGGGGGEGGTGGVVTQPDFHIPGLSAGVEVAFDAQGVLHLTCQTDEDCAAVLGWFHAQHRFWQMDSVRRAARGRLSTLIIDPGGAFGILNTDVTMRRYLSTRDGTPIEEAIWAIMPEETRSIVEAYALGVNAWLEDVRAGRNGASLTEEYGLPVVVGDPDSIPDWDPLDTVAFARVMTWQLSDSSTTEINAGVAYSRLPAEKAVALLTLAPPEAVNTYSAAGERYGSGVALQRAPAQNLEALEGIRQRLQVVDELLARAREEQLHAASFLGALAPDGARGSNNWVLAPERTQAGKALLANDPHLALTNPPIWYFAVLDAKTKGTGTMHVGGGTFPGIPGVPIGRNENVAWGNTTAYYDVTDVYVETLNEDGTAVLFDEDGDGTPEEIPIIRKEITFEPAGAEPVVRVLEWVPHHGPIVQKSVEQRRAVSVRWTGHDATDELTAFLRLGRSGSVDQARVALEGFQVGAQNFLLVDTGGNVAWAPHARVPRRPWASFDEAAPTDPAGGSLPPWLPLPGDGSAEWDGFLTSGELPGLVNPASGFIGTANQPMTGAVDDGDPTNDGEPIFQTFAAPGFRMARIAELEGALGNEHTPETMLEMQADVLSIPGRTLVPVLLAAADAADELRPATETLVGALRAWQFHCPTGLAGHAPDGDFSDDPVEARESIGCTAFHYALPRIYQHVFGDDLDGTGIAISHQLLRPLVLALQTDRTLPFDIGFIWDDGRTAETESRDEILLRALDATADLIAAHLGSDPDGWRWGRVHTLTLSHELSLLRSDLAFGPVANDGGLYTVDVANPSATATGRSFGHGNGASMRMVNEADGGGIRTWLQLPGGQDLHRSSAHYNDLLPGWLDHDSFVLAFTAEEIDEAAIERLLVMPPGDGE